MWTNMNVTVSFVICAVFLAIWLAANIGEHTLLKKKRDESAKKPQQQEERSGVYYGDRGYNDDRYKHF